MTKQHIRKLLLPINSLTIGVAISLFITPIISCYINHNFHYFLGNILWVLICFLLTILFFKLKINQAKLSIAVVLSSLTTWVILHFAKKEIIISIIQALWVDCQTFYHTDENAELAFFVISGTFLMILFCSTSLVLLIHNLKVRSNGRNENY